MMKRSIRDEIQELIKTNQTSEPLELSIEKFKSIDLMPLMKNQLSADAISILNIRSTGMIHQYDVRLSDNKYYERSYLLANFLEKFNFKRAKDFDQAHVLRRTARCYCFGYISDENRVGEAALKVTQVINNLADHKMILASLNPLTSLRLANGRYCTVSYLAVDSQYEQLVQSAYSGCIFSEGAVPPELP